MSPIAKSFDRGISLFFYPLVATAALLFVSHAVGEGKDLQAGYGLFVLGLLLVMVVTEAWHPARTAWRMSRQSFFRRDLPFIVIGALTVGLANYVAVSLGLSAAETNAGAMAGLPLIPGVLLAVLISDFIWYWLHRASHEWRGPVGNWLWRVHAAHHLPQQVYVLMHGVAHPINTFVVRLIFTLPTAWLGFSTDVVFAAGVLIGLQGMVSHFNVDIRVGWLNYLLVGTELHRYHHSASPSEGKNYAAVLPIWDQLFGTFVYRAGQLPARLGVEHPERLPAGEAWWQVLMLPFRQRNQT